MSTKSVKTESLKTSNVSVPLHATNLHSLMSPNFFVSLIHGYFPYKLEPPSYVFSRSRFVCSTLLIFCYAALLLDTLYQINFSNLITDNIVRIIQRNFFFFFDGSNIVVMYGLYRGKLHMIQDIFKTSQILSSEDVSGFGKLIRIKDTLSSVAVVVYLVQLSTKNVHSIILHYLVYYTLMVNLLTDMFYMNCVRILSACLGKINECLVQLMKTLIENECQSKVQTEKSSLEGQRNSLLLMRLKHLEEKHLQISDSVQLLNKTFLFRIIVLSISTFINATFNLYFFLIWMGRGAKDIMGAVYIVATIYHLGKFALVAWACECATNQTQKIGTTLHDLLSTATDASVKRELRMFSLQVLHHENKFSAKAFTMNLALLTKVLGGIMMYLLILFQFLLNSIACHSSKDHPT